MFQCQPVNQESPAFRRGECQGDVARVQCVLDYFKEKQ
jgi:hypothetical protein